MFGQAKASFLVSNPREQRICTIGEVFRVLKSRIFRARGVPRMPFRLLLLICFLLLASPCFGDEAGPPPLSIGASAPDFCLPGIDGQTHCLKDYNGSKVLVIVFTCNHCPTAQLYETRIKQIVVDYRGRGVAVVAIQPNNAIAVRL